MRNRTRWSLLIGALVPLSLAALLALSPYGQKPGFPYKLLAESVDVQRPCGEVFTYLGHSANASKWSAYVHHISPLNADKVPDGSQGSIRRSFRNADESGMRWDELFTVVEPERRRQLRIFNVVDSMSPKNNSLMTEQLYQPLGPTACRLSFTVFFERPPSIPDELAMSAAAYQIARVFRKNIGNVKRLVEAGGASAAAPTR